MSDVWSLYDYGLCHGCVVFGLVVVTLFQLYKYLFVITCSCKILSNFWSIVLSFVSIVLKSIMRRMNIMMNNITAVNVPFNESSIAFIIL